MNKKLEKQIAKKLTFLEQILEEIRNTDINLDDPELWDYDYYSDLETNLEKALELLEDKKDKKLKDQFGDPIILEKGILTLLDEHTSKEEEEYEDDE